jgi:hypothetical protein
MNRESRDHGNIGEKTDGAIMNRESRDHGNIGEKTDGAITYLYFILPKTDILKAGTARAPEIIPVLGGVSVFLCCVYFVFLLCFSSRIIGWELA